MGESKIIVAPKGRSLRGGYYLLRAFGWILYALGTVAVITIFMQLIFQTNATRNSTALHGGLVLSLTALSGLPALLVFLRAEEYSVKSTYSACLGLARNGVAIIMTMGIIVIYCISRFSLQNFPNSGDEYNFLFQTDTFLAGRFWNSLPPAPDFFTFSHIFEKDGKWVSQYPPGWAAFLAVGQLLRLPIWLIPIIMAVASVTALGLLVRRLFGGGAARVAMTVYVFCPFFLFNGASYFNHVPTALFSIVFVHAATRYLEQIDRGAALLAGVALGVVGTLRTYTAVLICIPFCVAFLRSAGRQHYLNAPVLILGGAPFLAALLYYNHQITGHALTPVTSWGYPLLKIGFFPVTEDGVKKDVIDTIKMAIQQIGELVEWTSPLVVILYGAVIVLKARARALAFYDFIPLSIVGGYLMYGDIGGNRYGPRYYFDGFAFVLVTLAWGWARITDASGRLHDFARASLAAHLILCAVSVPTFAYHIRRLVLERMDIFEQVETANLNNAIVFIKSSTGVIAPMMPHDLTRNGIDVGKNPVVYVRDRGTANSEIGRLFPERLQYFYERIPSERKGWLYSVEPRGK